MLLLACAQAAVNTEGYHGPAVAFVKITDDIEIQTINREQRGIDRATDVLSFPSVSYPEGVTARNAADLLAEAYDPEWNAVNLGDIILSVDHIRAQADEYGHSVSRETGYLLTHALFHLMGYDHMEEADRIQMRAHEKAALNSTGIQREEETTLTDEELITLAYEAREYAYAPYSGYKVGAALLSEDGRVFKGCNVENAAYPNTYCAERTALVKAVSEGARRFTKLAITGSGSTPYPCGACRQSLYEFAPNLDILIAWDGNVIKTNLSELLPGGFGPSSLGK
ncbi:MAG: cytidine deaminase [Clostridia bacterium]|nr:cytidine deaminase [Clostridia bacterium]